MSDEQIIPYNGNGDLMWSSAGFDHAFRVAQMFAASELVPAHLRGKTADVQIALSLAQQLGESPLLVLQSIYIVSGRAGWSAAYMISRLNRCGLIRGRLNWRIAGAGKELTVTAFATFADGTEASAAVSMAMAEAEGWTKNAKYRSMPELMLRYRSAAMLIRLYCPEVMVGMQTAEELETIPGADLPTLIDQPARREPARPARREPPRIVEVAPVAGIAAELAARGVALATVTDEDRAELAAADEDGS